MNVLSQPDQFDHLPILENFNAVTAFDFVPDVIWVFDLDRHGFWWGNTRALEFWGLDNLQTLIDKDLSADTEGVETDEQLDFLCRSDCAVIQGYLHAKPMPCDELEDYLAKNEL